MASSSISTSAAAASAAGTTYQVFLRFRGPDTRRGFTDVLYHALVDAGVRVFRDNEEIRKGEEIGEEILRAIEESRIFGSRDGNSTIKEYLVQRDDQVQALMKLVDIESSDVRFVGIYGMGGIGKTTLARVVFNKLYDRFDGCSFLADVRESSGQQKGIESLQKQLLGDLVHESEDIMDVGDGMIRLREKLARKNVLIVLDDVNSKEQIHNLAGDASWFSHGSRIIITTRDRSILEIRRLGIQTLEVEELKAEEASRLFCMHAFQKDSPSDDYLNLSEETVKSTGRLPLALAVIGSFLGDKPLQEWAGTIERLKKVPHKDVQKQLIISYEGLSHQTKQIFLDIACLFTGEEKTYPIYMWQACGFDPEMGLRELVYMSMVKVIVEEDGHDYIRGTKMIKKFWMHDQLRDLGRKIVRDESFEDGVKPSRIWMPNDALEMLREQDVKGRENVEMIRLHDDPAKGYTFTKRDLTRFEKLRYFACYSGNDASWMIMMVPNKLRGLSWHKHPLIFPKLRWFSWYSFPPKFWQVEFCLRKLVILDLSKSNIDENWRGWKQFGMGSPMKVLNLGECKRLKRIPDLSVFSSLERLILASCIRLVKIDSSISVMKSLVELDLFETSVSELPDTIGQLVKLEVLSLSYCRYLKKLPVSIGNMRSLVRLYMSGSGITELPDSIGNLENLRVMDMCWTRIKRLPSSFGMLERLEEMYASFSRLQEIPSMIEGLSCLRVLKLGYAYRLRLLPPKLPAGLTDVEISSDLILERVPEFSNLQNLVRLILIDGRSQEKGSREVQPIKLEGIGKLLRLLELDLQLWNVTCILEEELISLPQLQKLSLGCPNLQHFPPLPSTLSHLSLRRNGKKTEWPRLSNLKNMSTLEFRQFSIGDDTVGNLGIGELESLTTLSFIFCEFGNLPNGLYLLANIRKLYFHHCWSLPPLSHLKNLKELSIDGAQWLFEIPELGELKSLTSLSLCGCGFRNLDVLHMPANLSKLHIDQCWFLKALLALSHLKNLKELRIERSPELVEIQELGELESLQVLSIAHCDSLRGRLQNLSKLKKLRRIDILDCPKFKGIDGICGLESLETLSIKDCGCEDVEK